MKKKIFYAVFICLILLFSIAWKSKGWISDWIVDDLTVRGTAAIGTALQNTGDVARWDVEDLNGDVVVRLEAQCSDLTDGSQDCTLKIFTMNAGALTLQQTF